jgi:hypothetical protein
MIYLYSCLQKKTENENFPNVNLILSICPLTVNLLDKMTTPIEYLILKNVIEF